MRRNEMPSESPVIFPVPRISPKFQEDEVTEMMSVFAKRWMMTGLTVLFTAAGSVTAFADTDSVVCPQLIASATVFAAGEEVQNPEKMLLPDGTPVQVTDISVMQATGLVIQPDTPAGSMPFPILSNGFTSYYDAEQGLTVIQPALPV